VLDENGDFLFFEEKERDSMLFISHSGENHEIMNNSFK